MKKLLLVTSNYLSAQGWGQTQKIVPLDRALGDFFGQSVAMDGDYAVVGSFQNDTPTGNSGSAYIYKRDMNGNWTEHQKITTLDKRQYDQFGEDVDIDGDLMIIGSRGQDYDANNDNFQNAAGAAYIFENDGNGNWTEIQKIVSSNRGETFQPIFGRTVAISGDYAVVNAPWENTGLNGQPDLNDAGACYIFERNINGVWEEVQKIVSSNRDVNERWGEYAIDMSGNTIIVGSIRENLDASNTNELDFAGAVYVFERDVNGIWNEVQKIVNSDREWGDTFGRAVSIDGNSLIIGADYEDINGSVSGAAYMFEKDGTGVWNEVQKITSASGVADSRFGQRVAIDGDRTVIGAWIRDVGGVTYGGAAYIFEKDGAGFWNETAVMYDPDVSIADYFGYSVAISGDYCFVGANEEKEDENNENTLEDAGSAFIFNINELNTLPPLNTLSVVENDFNANLKVFPNPTNGKLTIDLKKAHASTSISIHNVLGQQVFTQKYQTLSKISLELPTDNGVYFITISKEDGQIATLKIIKQS